MITYRTLCIRCLQSQASCYCAGLRPFFSECEFAILIHPHEVRRRVATGRMAHLCIKNSHLIPGHTFENHPRVNALLADPGRHAVILYPGKTSLNISGEKPQSIRDFISPAGRTPLIFVIDGTWATAKNMILHSPNLRALPQISFTPKINSTFRVRKQPKDGCLSTIEAIHQLIDALKPENRAHDNLIEVFDSYVERQLDFAEKSREQAIRTGTFFPRKPLSKKLKTSPSPCPITSGDQ